MGRSHGDLQIVGGAYSLAIPIGIGVFELEVPLVARNGHIQYFALVGGGLVQFEEGEYRPDAQAQDQGRGNDSPCNFKGGVPVDLRRPRLPRPTPVTDDDVQQRALNQDENDNHRPEQDVE